jgi:N-methylhydantoinase A
MPASGDLAPEAAIRENRQVSFAPGQMQAVPVYDGAGIAIGGEIEGPAVIEEETTTILVPPGWRLRLDGSQAWFMSRPGFT